MDKDILIWKVDEKKIIPDFISHSLSTAQKKQKRKSSGDIFSYSWSCTDLQFDSVPMILLSSHLSSVCLIVLYLEPFLRQHDEKRGSQRLTLTFSCV